MERGRHSLRVPRIADQRHRETLERAADPLRLVAQHRDDGIEPRGECPAGGAADQRLPVQRDEELVAPQPG